MKTITVTCLTSLRDKVVGLIGTAAAHPVMFHTRWGIHTFGMKFPIDVLILGNNLEVVKLAENLAPNLLFFWNPRYHTAIELPAGWVSKNGIARSDRIHIIAVSPVSRCSRDRLYKNK